MELIRTFIAVEVSYDVKETAAFIQKELQKFNCRVSWTRMEGMHLTLKFLGDTNNSLIDELGEALREIVSAYAPFPMTLKSAGVFGGGNPRILWLGFAESLDLLALQEKVDKRISEFGFPPERKKFHPHLTLGRIKEPYNAREMAKYLVGRRIESISFTVDEVSLFKSELRPTGAVYTSLCEAPLNR
jgi:2'-5' RNA ligase